jgi:predicted ATPase
VKKRSQFIIATHSPILMAYPGAEILELSETGIRSVNYRDTEHYQLTRRFLENPEKMLHYLLDE